IRYLNWTNHGESHEVSSSSMASMEGSMGERERERERDLNCEKRNDKKKFDDLVKDGDQKFLQEELLPHRNILPKKHHEVKNIMNKLGLGWRPNQEDNSRDESGDKAGMQDESGMQDEAGLQDETGLQNEAGI
ncbi:hypothetical protein Tco_0944350, partial [Tanacetum coccineum]